MQFSKKYPKGYKKHSWLYDVWLGICCFLVLMAMMYSDGAKACEPKAYSPSQVDVVAAKYKLNAQTLFAIIQIESSGNQYAFNSRTKDYGLMQINEKTAAALGLDTSCLLKNSVYNLEAGAKVLSYMQKRFSSKESTWICRYNLGTRQKVKNLNACKIYVTKYLNAKKQLIGAGYVAQN